MKTMIDVSREMMPDCCISCQELMIDDGTLSCYIDGIDTLPFKKCNDFKRLKYYGEYKEELKMAM